MNSKPVDWSRWKIKEIPLIERNRGKCRTCKHGEYWHYQDNPACDYNSNHEVKAVDRSQVEILVPQETNVSICSCLEYVPGDNLAYLEWCHDRRRV